MREHGEECWGFVIFRTCYRDEGAWQKFREYFAKVAETSVLHYNSGPLLWPSFRAVFVEDKALNGASNEELRMKFRKMRSTEQLPKGIRTTCFLVADPAVIEDPAAKMPYAPRYRFDLQATLDIRPEDPMVFIRAVDPDYEVEDDATSLDDKGDEVQTKQPAEEHGGNDLDGFKGEARLILPKVFDWLHEVCYDAEHEGNLAGHGGWQEIYAQTRSPPESWVLSYSSNTGGVSYSR
jgi:hypothetical protein